MLSRKKRFSLGAPPRITISFLKEGELETPGKLAITFEISRFPPGLLRISEALIVLKLVDFLLFY